MDINPIFLIELIVFNGAVLAWALYEYWSVRPKRDDPSEQTPGHAEGEHGADEG